MRLPKHPYALDTPVFSFASLAALAARAPLGGAREVAVATFAAVRMAEELRPDGLPVEERQARAAAGRKWMSTLSLAEPVKRALLELIAATERDASATAAALRRVTEVTGGGLDAASRSEVERLARELDTQTVGRT
ncbi:MAG TPA: hypothetical protein VFO55_10150 [Gemmatimonadaceae bacterium]|nr:hypothetical protein [Gemmatimonadaceae bacterium]